MNPRLPAIFFASMLSTSTLAGQPTDLSLHTQPLQPNQCTSLYSHDSYVHKCSVTCNISGAIKTTYIHVPEHPSFKALTPQAACADLPSLVSNELQNNSPALSYTAPIIDLAGDR